MDGDHDTLILSRLKDPWKFLMLDMDIGMVAVAVGFGALSMNMHVFLVVGLPAVVAYGMHKMRQNKARGFGAHWAYWHLPEHLSGLQRTPASHCHRTIG